MSETYGLYAAKEAAGIIAKAAQAIPNCRLKKILLYGSIARGNPGHDIDLILEVDRETFQAYAGECMVVLDGIHPVSDDLLERFHSAAWDYFSPKLKRSEVAAETVGINLDELDLGGPKEALDVICLPEGWDDRTSAAHLELQFSLRRSRDPGFIEKAIRSKVQVFPPV